MSTCAPLSALWNLMAQVRFLMQRKVTNGEIMHLFLLQTKAEVGQAWTCEGAAHRVMSWWLLKRWFCWTCERRTCSLATASTAQLSRSHTHTFWQHKVKDYATSPFYSAYNTGWSLVLKKKQKNNTTCRCIDLHFLYVCRLVDHTSQNLNAAMTKTDSNHTLSTPPTHWTKI